MALIGIISVSEEGTSYIVALGAIGWTVGSALCARLITFPRDMLFRFSLQGQVLCLVCVALNFLFLESLFLLGAAVGTMGFCMGIAFSLMPQVLTQGHNIGLTAENMSALETMDTIWTTLVMSSAGVIIMPFIANKSSLSITVVLIAIGVFSCALFVAEKLAPIELYE